MEDLIMGRISEIRQNNTQDQDVSEANLAN